MRRSLVAIVVVLVLAGLAVAAVPLAERHLAARIKSEIEAGGTTRIGAVEVGLFDRSVVLSGVRSSRAGETTIQRWQAAGLSWPLAELVRGRTPFSGWRLGDPLYAENVALEDLRITDAGGAVWSVGSLQLEGFDLARYDADVGANPNRTVVLGARLLHALSLRRLEHRNVVFTAPASGEVYRFGALRLDDLRQGKLGAFALGDFEVMASRGESDASFRLSEVAGKDLDLSRVVAAIASPSWGPGSPIGRIGIGSLGARGFGGRLLSRYGVTLDSVTHESTRQGEGVLRSETRIRGLVLAPPLRGEGLALRMAMQSMGLKELKLEFDCSGTEDRPKSELLVDRCALTGADLAQIDASLKIVNVDPAFWHAIDEGDMAGLQGSKAGLGAARLVVADKSLLDRALKAAAAATGQPAATLRAEVAREVRRYQPAGVLISEEMTKLLDTVGRFVEQGGTLTIEARPSRPIGMDRVSYIMSPGADLVEVLGLSATLSR